MYQLLLSTPVIQIWVSSNGWRRTIVRGVVISCIRYPAPGSKQWLAMLP